MTHMPIIHIIMPSMVPMMQGLHAMLVKSGAVHADDNNGMALDNSDESGLVYD